MFVYYEVLKDPQILEMWDANATLIPAKYEAYSLELLKAVVELWARGTDRYSDT